MSYDYIKCLLNDHEGKDVVKWTKLGEWRVVSYWKALHQLLFAFLHIFLSRWQMAQDCAPGIFSMLNETLDSV